MLSVEMGFRRYFFVFLLALGLIFQNCSDVGFEKFENQDESSSQVSLPVDTTLPTPIPSCSDPQFSGQNVSGECLALIDIFDRESVVGGDQFNWTSIIDDVLRDDHANVQATIINQGEYGFGEAAAGEGAVYVTGRKGGSVHEVFLISVPLNLEKFDQLRLEFNYLPIHLENWNWQGQQGEEHIRLEVCSASLFECGIDGGSDNHKKQALRSSSWTAVFTQQGFSSGELASFERGLNNDGRNHYQSSWLLGGGTVNLNQEDMIADKTQVVFRITIMLDEGFLQKHSDNTPVFESELIDGMGLDNVKAFAISK